MSDQEFTECVYRVRDLRPETLRLAAAVAPTVVFVLPADAARDLARLLDLDRQVREADVTREMEQALDSERRRARLAFRAGLKAGLVLMLAAALAAVAIPALLLAWGAP